MPDFKKHGASGHISIDRYEKSLIVELGRSIEGCIPVYLDVNFWILLRKVVLGDDTSAAAFELLTLLRTLVADGTIFCPISETTYLELVKQTDQRTRECTARLMDELGLGIALIPYDRRIGTELAVFFHSFSDDPGTLHPLKHLVWTKVAYVMGVSHPLDSRFDAATMLMVQKAFMDVMWALPLTEVADEKIKYFPGEDFNKRWAATTNAGVAQHANTLKSFQQALDDELRGAASAVPDLMVEVINANAESKNIPPAVPGSKQYNDALNVFQNAVYYALKRKPEYRLQMPSFYIEAALHAAFRWNKTRKFKPNDIHDFHHACAALAYCKVFLTEGPLHTLLQTRHLGLDKLYACKVFSDAPSAITHLRTLKVSSAA